MSTVTVVATLEASNLPPRVRLDVTDTGSSPALFATTVTRLDPDGRTVPVRTADGNPLVLTTSGSNRVGLLYDYEVPYGQPVSYSTLESPSVRTPEVTVPEGHAWLIHPGVPELSMPIEPRIGSLAEEEWGVQEGVHWVMGRSSPVVQTDGTRKAPASSVTVAIDTLDQLRALRTLLTDAGVLLLNIPPAMQWGVDTCYIAVGRVRNARVSDIGSDPYRSVVLPFQIVDRPVGGSQAERTYTDLVATYGSYGALMTTYDTYLALLSGP